MMNFTLSRLNISDKDLRLLEFAISYSELRLRIFRCLDCNLWCFLVRLLPYIPGNAHMQRLTWSLQFFHKSIYRDGIRGVHSLVVLWLRNGSGNESLTLFVFNAMVLSKSLCASMLRIIAIIDL